MPKVNRKAGIHLHHTGVKSIATKKPIEYYWILIAKNGKTIARSSETYKRKGSAVKSINIAARLFYGAETGVGWNYYDHSAKQVKEDFVQY